MHLITRFTAALASFTLVGAMCVLPERANSKEPGCVTWSEKKSEIQSLFNQNFGYNRPLPELPNGFKNGCIFGNLGASTIAIYVLKDGLRPHAVQNNDTLFGTSIPKFSSVDVGSATVENGEVLLLHSVCGSTGTASFCEDIPKNRPYIKNGLACLQNLCLRANSVPNTELVRLWAATLKPTQPNSEESQISQLIRNYLLSNFPGMSNLQVDHVLIEGNYAYAGWHEANVGGTMALQKQGESWVILGKNGGVIESSELKKFGVPNATAEKLWQRWISLPENQ